MADRQTLLETWQDSVRVMHIAHNLAASRYASRHRWFGSLTAALSAIISASAFIALQDKGQMYWLVATGLLSITAAICTAINTFLGHEGRAKQHHHVATLFQGVRREIEEEIAFFKERNAANDYEKIRRRWSETVRRHTKLDRWPPDLRDTSAHQV